MVVVVMVMVVGGADSPEAHLIAHVVDGLLEQLEPLAAGGAGLHSARQVELLQELQQLLVQRQVLAVGRQQQAVHWGADREADEVEVDYKLQVAVTLDGNKPIDYFCY